jgi:hypothetical protein
MQKDMHYYGTYCMARAAGFKRDAAKIVATSAQFVDDNATRDSIEMRDGARLDVEASAHHTYDLDNTVKIDQRFVWVPFHFLPGGEGESFTEKLICCEDSENSKKMIDHALSKSDSAFALEQMGVAAHVYADTFSHYGFSGVSSRRNKVDNDSFVFEDLDPTIETYIKDKAVKYIEEYGEQGGLMDNIKSWIAETASGALGHGAVMTYPDRPYLVWSFDYEYPEVRKVRRDNPASFLRGCKALHNMFRRFLEKRSDFAADEGVVFSDIEATVIDILSTQAAMQGRIEAWQKAAECGDLFEGDGESIPEYNEKEWHGQRGNIGQIEDSSEVTNLPVYRFYQAVAEHRWHVLRDLLPANSIVVV